MEGTDKKDNILNSATLKMVLRHSSYSITDFDSCSCFLNKVALDCDGMLDWYERELGMDRG